MRGHRDRGVSLSTFIVLLVPMMLVCVGLVVDGGARARATARAELVAGEAAVAGADASVPSQVAGLDDSGAARAAARKVLERHGMQGEVHVVAGEIRVTTRTSTPTTFLQLVGIRRVHGRGSATATLVRR